MYGFGDAAPTLTGISGPTRYRLHPGSDQTQLTLTRSVLPDANLSIEGRYVREIRAGERADADVVVRPKSSSGRCKTDFRWLSPESAELAFSNGDTLRIFDDGHYECLILRLADKIVVV